MTDKPHKAAKVDVWDSAATKNALDDAIKKVMTDDFNCDEDHSLMNGRLVLSAIGVGFAGYACLWDYLHPFPESRPVLIICACSYFVLMGILTLYIMYKEKGIFYIGLEKDKAGVDPPNVWTFTSEQKKYDDIFELSIQYKSGTGTGQFRESTVKESVTKFFDEKGTLREDLFCPFVKDTCQSLAKSKKTQ